MKIQVCLRHRGPDDFGIWLNSQKNLAIINRRLAITDESTRGRQPMTSQSKRWTISMNGEIYNFRELREDLKKRGCETLGESDTEVLVNLFDYHSVPYVLSILRGMFAFILYDQKEDLVYLARDRAGEKPLYYGFINQDFVASSELKAFHEHPHFTPKIDETSVTAFFKYGYVPTPRSIFKNIYKLKPAHVLVFDAKNRQIKDYFCYWKYKLVEGDAGHFNEDSLVSQTEERLLETLAMQIGSINEVNCMLSGGVDSSIVVALARRISAKPVRTFSLGFNEPSFDESAYASSTAKALGSQHSPFYMNGKDALSVVDKMSYVFDEPFADSSQIPTFFLAQQISASTKVVFTGDGGDELFVGYNRYAWASRLWRTLNKIPTPIKPALSQLGLAKYKALFSLIRILPREGVRIRDFEARLDKIRNFVPAKNASELFDRIISINFTPRNLFSRANDFTTVTATNESLENYLNFMLAHDFNHYLPDDILVKVDRATMASGLEARTPFLDPHLMDWISTQPNLRSEKRPKYVLTQILERYLPPELVHRPKMGFSAPIAKWIRAELKDWAYSSINSMQKTLGDTLDISFVTAKMSEHMSEQRDHSTLIWSVLTFSNWYNRWIENTLDSSKSAQLIDRAIQRKPLSPGI